VTVLGVNAPVASSAGVKFVAVLVSDLPTRLSSPILATFGKTLIQIRTNDALVEFGAADIFHAVERVLVGVVLDEAETAWGFLEAVQAHHKSLDLTASAVFVSNFALAVEVEAEIVSLAEELVNLLLGGVEGEVADVERRGILELVFEFELRRSLTLFVRARSALSSALSVTVVLSLTRLWRCKCELAWTCDVLNGENTLLAA
jgi:hypothetical protein